MTRITLSIACGLAVATTGAMIAPATIDAGEPQVEVVLEAAPGEALKAALDRAIDDERHAIAFYRAVLEKHGQRRPFSNIINAERRHEAALLAQYARLGYEVPADRWADHEFAIADRFADLCDASVVAEVRNGRIYDELIEACTDPVVRNVFERLRWASIERHLPAFRRHGSGWDELPAQGFDDRQRVQRDEANAAQGALFAALSAELSEAMGEGGPTRAIEVCATRAPAIAAEVSEQRGVRIGRTSHRLRNPGNSPPPWADLAVDERPEQPRYFSDRNGRLGALTPIRLGGSCIQCHGSPDDIAPETRSSLDRRYPGDRATGFSVGDIRGWFWVEVPPAGGG